MQKFFRVVIGTNNIDGCARVCHAPTAMGMQWAFGTGAATNSISDIYKTELYSTDWIESHKGSSGDRSKDPLDGTERNPANCD